MISKRKRLQNCSLYLILDAEVASYDRLFEVMKEASLCGVDIVQLRDKLGTPRDMIRFSLRALRWLKGKIPFIVNDRVDCAVAACADGVHLGQDDVPVSVARSILGRGRIIGKSCQTLSHLRQAQAEGVDYVGFGSVFRTQTKPGRPPMEFHLLRSAVKSAAIPLFGIGGITRDNLGAVTACGLRRVAVCREILRADCVESAVRRLKGGLTQKNKPRLMRE